MTLVRHIALFLALAVATVAISLAPSSAQAHEGRAHAAVSVIGHVVHNVPAGFGRTETAVATAAHLDCNGPCCTGSGHHGSCCCATGLAPPSVAVAGPAVIASRSPAPEPAPADGIAPEAIPEPPRPFA